MILKIKDENGVFKEINISTIGKDGLSAYQIWLLNGNKGTEEDFKNSLTPSNFLPHTLVDNDLFIGNMGVISINSIEYSVAKGMIWEDFINSSLNTNNYYITNNEIKHTDAEGTITVICYTDGSRVQATDTITMNYQYLQNSDISLITFYIYSTPHTAIKDMTWGEFINSEYNTNNAFSILDDYVYYDDTTDFGYVVPENDYYRYFSESSPIVDGQEYQLNIEPI